MRLKVVVGGKHLVLALQFHAPMRQFAIELVEFRYILGQQGRSSQQRKGTIHHVRIRCHSKSVNMTVLLGTQLLAHALWNRL